MTQTKNDRARQWLLPKRIVIACLGLFFCFVNVGNGFASEEAKAIANVKQIKAQTKITPQQQMKAVQRYLHRLSSAELIELTREIGGERFISNNPSSPQTGKMNRTGQMHSVEKIKSATQSGAKQDAVGAKPLSFRQQKLQASLRSPMARERYLDAVANYLLNTTK
jgi:hypothetical protein